MDEPAQVQAQEKKQETKVTIDDAAWDQEEIDIDDDIGGEEDLGGDA